MLSSIKLFPFSYYLNLLDHVSASSHIWRPSFVQRKTILVMAPKKANSKATTSIDKVGNAALLAKKKGKATLADDIPQEAFGDEAVNNKKHRQDNLPTPEGTIRTCSSVGVPRAPPLGLTPRGRRHRRRRRKLRHFSRRPTQAASPSHLEQSLTEAKRNTCSQAPVHMQAKVRQMILDEEQNARELEQQIADMQGEHHYQLQQNSPYILVVAPTTFHGINYLDERSPLAPQLQASPWPSNFIAGTYPMYNSSIDLAQYIMSYQITVASSGGVDATMAKSIIIALEGLALTWYTRLLPLPIDSWKTLCDKFLLNFQGHRPDTDALAELSLYRQHEK
jgi:hypothetical protein